MSFPRYGEYRDSGVEWLGEVPAHWELRRLRSVAQLNPTKAEVIYRDPDTAVPFLPMEAVGEDGSLDLTRERPLSELQSGYTYFREEDVAFAKITPCFENGKGARMTGLAPGFGFGTTELTVLRPYKSILSGRFLHHLLTSREFRLQGEGHMYGAGGQKRVPDEFVRNFAVALPPLADQELIADFLGSELAKLGQLVTEQQRLIELLEEKRQAVISHAVTKGLNPDVPMKDSGVEWLGEVPSHWRIVRLGNLLHEVLEPGDDELPVLSVSIHDGVSDRELNEEELARKVVRSEDRSKYKRVRPGDLVYNMMRAWQGAFGTVTIDGMVSPAYVVARARDCSDAAFIEQVLRTSNAITEMRRHSQGVTDFRLRLYWDAFKNIRIALPPSTEIEQIMSTIAQLSASFAALTEAAEHAITLLQERRTALISAAVTGKIDVRNLVDAEAVAACA